MGSVLDIMDCPNCGNEAHSDYNYKTGEEYTLCQNCGYHKSITIKDRTKKLSEITEADIEVVEILNPEGVFRIKWKGSVAWEVGTIVDTEHLKHIESVVEEHKADIEQASYNKLEDGQIKTIHFLL
jgi:Zn ribbon nucleic-acid-binding protein